MYPNLSSLEVEVIGEVTILKQILNASPFCKQLKEIFYKHIKSTMPKKCFKDTAATQILNRTLCYHPHNKSPGETSVPQIQSLPSSRRRVCVCVRVLDQQSRQQRKQNKTNPTKKNQKK